MRARRCLAFTSSVAMPGDVAPALTVMMSAVVPADSVDRRETDIFSSGIGLAARPDFAGPATGHGTSCTGFKHLSCVALMPAKLDTEIPGVLLRLDNRRQQGSGTSVIGSNLLECLTELTLQPEILGEQCRHEPGPFQFTI